ncbi:glutathione S-transferase family protein [Rhizobium sp. P38BS-XIX]|uniref:glutathione S-transferase family protein n=1 Tax=Rhizobium sp. P38BS-XIX TaxID=2726740 RepID=UPI0014570B49|nr:glutathione S-transferase family protein [Rhizobium sp. P38BS-XIX]NLS00697.1 glutathione S-transferase family protein [Rhizobium sp. P38BS-XIX]
MKIYDRAGFPNPTRIRIVVAQKELESKIEFVPVDLIGAEHKQAAFLAKNPAGVLPVLELDDGTLISECTAITEYLDNLDGNPELTGRTASEKALIHMMQRRAEAFVLDPLGIFFHHATPGLGQALQAYKSPEWQGRTEMGQREAEKAQEGLHYFNSVLAEQQFLAGDAFSMADITLLAGLAFAEALGVVPADLPALKAWQDRVAEIPAVKNRSGQSFLPEDLKRMGY